MRAIRLVYPLMAAQKWAPDYKDVDRQDPRYGDPSRN